MYIILLLSVMSIFNNQFYVALGSRKIRRINQRYPSVALKFFSWSPHKSHGKVMVDISNNTTHKGLADSSIK